MVGDCEAPKEGKVDNNTPIQTNAPWEYKPGSSNLFGAMASRAEEALKAAPEGSQIAGILWYQVHDASSIMVVIIMFSHQLISLHSYS